MVVEGMSIQTYIEKKIWLLGALTKVHYALKKEIQVMHARLSL